MGVTLGMLPALLALFQQFSLVSPLANAVAIPLVSFVITPLALAGVLPFLDPLLSAGEFHDHGIDEFYRMAGGVAVVHLAAGYTAVVVGFAGVGWRSLVIVAAWFSGALAGFAGFFCRC
jgi:competence protein ComEC